MSETEQPPPELRSLFEAERAAPRVDTSARVALRARLASSVAKVPLGQAAAGSLLGGAGKALVIVAITIAAGAGTVAVIKHVERNAPVAVAEFPPPRESHDGLETPSVVTATVARTENVEHRPVTTARRQPPRDVAAEQPEFQNVVSSASQPELLRQAWTALRAGDGGRALALAKEDERLHREGVLVEERQALEICALANLDRMDEARAAADSFFQQHPDSVHRSLIEQHLERR